MKLRVIHLLIIVLILFSTLVSATTLKGSIYNSNLELENNVLVEINTVPQQKYLAKDGSYSFELSQGVYNLTARSNEFTVVEEVIILSDEGEYLFDIFLLPDFSEEDKLWQETENDQISIDPEEPVSYDWRTILGYSLLALLFILAIIRIIWTRKKYGPLGKFRKRIKEESKKTIEEHKEELAQEPGYLDNAIEIIKKHDGRITQKELRKEMLYLSEGKVSLIVTELEHKGKIEKIKKGRGNVIILK